MDIDTGDVWILDTPILTTDPTMLHDRIVSPVAPHVHAPIPYDVGYVILIVRVDADNADAGMVMLMLVLLPYILLLYTVLAIGNTDGISLLMVLSNWLEYEYRY